MRKDNQESKIKTKNLRYYYIGDFFFKLITVFSPWR